MNIFEDFKIMLDEFAEILNQATEHKPKKIKIKKGTKATVNGVNCTFLEDALIETYTPGKLLKSANTNKQH